MVLSFNGGKDATVLLHLVRAAVAGFIVENCGEQNKDSFPDARAASTDSLQQSARVVPIKCVYFVDGKAFPEMEEFLQDMTIRFDLSLERFHGSYKDGCRHMVDQFRSKAFFLGTRKSDPHGQFVDSFSPSSKGWPAFMRIHPILSWSFADIWRFLKEFQLPYCKLYDEGYTSLGSRFDTEKNPALMRSDGTYRPAYTLVLEENEEDMERKGRKPASEKPPSPAVSHEACEVGVITVGDEVLSAKVRSAMSFDFQNTACTTLDKNS